MHIEIKPIVDALDGKKEVFISTCRRDIESLVSSYGRDSLAIQEIGGRVHYAAPDNYIKVLWKFRKGERYHGYQLKSYLSDPVARLVVEKYNEFLQEHKSDIEEQLMKQVVSSINIAITMEAILYEELARAGIKHIRHEVAEQFVNACQGALHSQLGQTSTAAVSHTLTTTVGTTVGAAIAHALAVAIVHAIGTAMIHLAHSVAFKAILHAALAHSAGVIVTAILVKLVAAHMTAAGASAALGPFAMVAGGAFIFYKIVTIPDKLGEKLGEALADHMRGEFRPLTEKALAACFKEMLDPEKLLKSVVKAKIKSSLPEIMGDLTKSTSDPPDYSDIDKDVGNLVGYAGKGMKKMKPKKGRNAVKTSIQQVAQDSGLDSKVISQQEVTDTRRKQEISYSIVEVDPYYVEVPGRYVV